MSGLSKGFEKVFPLPWEVKIIDTATFIQSEFEPGEHTIKFNADNIAHVDALEYMVKCANLMPECVNMLKEADMYMTSMLAGLCNDCPDKGTEMCRVCKLKTVLDDIETLLAKLEGGAETE